MFLGFISIGLIINDEPLKAGVLILFAGVFDVFDGKIARILGIESKFSKDLSEKTFNELKELKKLQKIN